MPRIVAAALIAALANACAPQASAPTAEARIVASSPYADSLAATVMITREDGAHGSGVIVGGLVLTNAHVVAGDKVLAIALYDGRRLEGLVVWKDETHDLAAIAVRAPGLGSAELRCDQPAELGEPVYVAGNPASFDFTITWGHVAHLARLLGDRVYLQIDAVIFFGNSGGPVFDRRGRVIGVVAAAGVAQLPNGQILLTGHGFAIPITRVCAVLEERGR